MKTSFYFSGTWIHVRWNSNGSRGRDQHDQLWFDMEAPVSDGGMAMNPEENPSYAEEVEKVKKAAALSNKDRFMQERAMFAERGRERIERLAFLERA